MFDYCLFTNEEDFEFAKQQLGWHKHEEFLPDESVACVRYMKRDDMTSGICVVCVKPHLNVVEAATSIVHEAVHVWQDHRKHIGEEKASDEFEAYAIEHIFRNLYNDYLEQTVN